MNKKVIQAALKDTIPIMTGYLFLGFGFGILMQQNGFNLLLVLLMSVFIYAGSMQYVAVGLLSSGVGPVTAALTTLLVNARHLFYGITMINAYKGAGRKKPYLIFALTDETFSLVSKQHAPEGMNYHSYCFWVSLLNQCYWIIGSTLGCTAGAVLPINFKGIDFVLTALFVTIFVEQWLSTKNHTPAIVGVASTAFCLLLFGKDIFLIPSMLVIIGILIAMKLVKKEAR